ncbi:MAG TPA: trehalase family glycosidase [Chitinophagaceae bacterium]|nr:trehalase family glycosidase [Chitinophagaceae bacterium]
MKKQLLAFIAAILSITGFSQTNAGVTFFSSDTALQEAFNRAKAMALRYKGKPGDAVGAWYESALPPRSAFCMRDVSHQCIGGEILGLSAANRNMLYLFAKNISESKDWCSYWEMNKYGKPAPEDYRNDTAFWYNLNANFDVMQACWQLYLWTGETRYIQDPVFRNFFDRTVNDYIKTWVLQPDSLLSRPAYPYAPKNFNEADAFQRCRGLPSYSEGVPGIKMGVDLVAAIYRGLEAYAGILQWRGDTHGAQLWQAKAAQYRQEIDRRWWDDKAGLYNTYYTKQGGFGKSEGETFLLWFDALKDSVRKRKTIQHLLLNDWNVENQSYFPVILYREGYYADGYRYILHLTDPATKRREYPEVSFGVIRGITEGLMGIAPDARNNSILTLYKGNTANTCTIQHVPVLGTTVSVTHVGDTLTIFTNHAQKTVRWRAAFRSNSPALVAAGKMVESKHMTLPGGETVVYTDVAVAPGKTITVSVNATQAVK